MWARPETLSAVIAVTVLVVAGIAGASISVQPGERIQTVIDAAAPGETIEVHGGSYKESLKVDKQLILKGIDSGGGLPQVTTENGAAITLKANGIVLEGFWAKSASGWTGDAGILVVSSDNILRGNMASGNGNIGILLQDCTNNTLIGNVVEGNGNEGIFLKNCNDSLLEGNRALRNKYGLKMESAGGNRIQGNSFLENKLDAIYLKGSQSNTIEGNYALGNEGALTMDTCRDNLVRKNDFVGNEKGIYVSYLDSSKTSKSGAKGVVISYSSMPSQQSVSSNNTLYQNNLSNSENAYDDSNDYWDNGRIGNNYSNYNDPSEGCIGGGKICESEYAIPGGLSVDQYPQASPVKKPGRTTGPGGTVLELYQTSFLPGAEMLLNYTAPSSTEVWVGLEQDGGGQSEQYLGRNVSGNVAMSAPQKEGHYRLVMHDKNGTAVTSLPFNVTVPSISAQPASVRTCEDISVSFAGASGQKNSWIGMFAAGSDSAISKEKLAGRESGTVTFAMSESGSVVFKMFNAGAAVPLVTSGVVEVAETGGSKVVAEPSHVSPGGTVTVTYWGAPAQGTGVIGMYGMTRPDKFSLGKKPLGSKSCGSMTWRLPKAAGQYDFRMFQSDITSEGQGAYQLLAQSNVVTVS